MVTQTQLALNDAAEWLGDWHPLAEQLGSADGLVTLGSVSASLRLMPVYNLPTLSGFLRNYQSQVLLPFELPAIHRSHGHASCLPLGHEFRPLSHGDSGREETPAAGISSTEGNRDFSS